MRGAVEAHYPEPWLVDGYVEALATTPHLLDKAARQVLGMSVKDVVLELRLLEAKRLLMFTIRPVEGIAFETGFGDGLIFHAFFAAAAATRPRPGVGGTSRQNSGIDASAEDTLAFNDGQFRLADGRIGPSGR
ncbi:transcriptional regulator GlxA family with amidase domain [Aminobacter lissarensis]|uniref:Transcriptional regulator GlxA family with amidase domain n=1 Tax=Aminobacter carboxidus TaxID=376165 RepID=A0A8E1WJU9_9HYPH|nr:AraC family transcriptional regulator [Aminobacter lissarensis]MBB6468447.1 transcriptional regulator GlxA family with amidase domain [Aminobacter lissarensis]